MSWLPLSESKGVFGSGIDHINALTEMRNANELRKINAVKAQYAPLTTKAEALSKLAYSLNVGPQYLAKQLNNPAFVANLEANYGKGAVKNALGTVYNAASNASGLGSLNLGSGGNGYNITDLNDENKSDNSFGGQALNHLKGLFGFDDKSEKQKPANAMLDIPIGGGMKSNPMAYDQNDITANGGTLAPGEDPNEYVKYNNVNSPDYVGNQDKQVALPPLKGVANPQNAALPQKNDEASWFENLGKSLGLQEELKEEGPIRAKQREKLDETVFNSETNQGTLNELSDIVASPVFEGIRATPLAGHHELAYYAKEGDADQKYMVGQYYALTGNLIKDASRDFAGQFRKGEQQLLNSMKPGPSDTVDTAKGKIATLSLMNKMLMERSRLTSKIMSKYHGIGKLEASELADARVDGDKMRKDIHDRLYKEPAKPNITEDHIKWMAQKNGVSVDEAKKRLKAKGLL